MPNALSNVFRIGPLFAVRLQGAGRTLSVRQERGSTRRNVSLVVHRQLNWTFTQAEFDEFASAVLRLFKAMAAPSWMQKGRRAVPGEALVNEKAAHEPPRSLPRAIASYLWDLPARAFLRTPARLDIPPTERIMMIEAAGKVLDLRGLAATDERYVALSAPRQGAVFFTAGEFSEFADAVEQVRRALH